MCDAHKHTHTHFSLLNGINTYGLYVDVTIYELIYWIYRLIDFSSGSGMNLLDIKTRCWSEVCLEATAPGLGKLLGAPQPSTTVLVRGPQAG
jgi:hypothetical protein